MMWNWIRGEFNTLLIVLERDPKVWIVPCIFFLFCIAVMAWLNFQLNHYFETRSVTQMTPILDQFIVSFYDKIRGKLVNRYLIMGSLVLLAIGYLKCRKKRLISRLEQPG